VQEQLADNKPLEDVLKRVLKTSPTLAKIFGAGTRLHNPFKPENVQPSQKPFVGKPHPTFFRFAGKEEGEILARAAHLESRVRVAFDTDAVDDYFTRKVDRGIKDFARIVDAKRVRFAFNWLKLMRFGSRFGFGRTRATARTAHVLKRHPN
jgi:hypothetical protein